jgi:putative DNA primase/helicase
MKSSMMDAALDYANQGYAVFPCEKKKPLTDNGFKDATTDETQIREWWRRWPNAQVALPTGRRNNLFVVDLDSQQAQEDAKRWNLPETFIVETRPCRMQLWFQQPLEIETKCSTGILAPKVDTRGDGGYVIAPPSIHHETRAPYRIVKNIPYADAGMLPAFILRPEKNGASGNGAAPRLRGDKIPRGSHDSELTRIAGKLRRDGLEEGAISSALIEACEKRCENYGPDYKRMCAKIARSVCHYPVPEPHEKITDAGNADLLVAAERDNLLYCFEMKKWLCWDGKRWRVDDSQQARALMEKTMRARIAQVAATGTAKEVARASECLDSHRLTNGLREAEKKLGVTAADLDTKPFLITFDNGTINLETMQFGPHSRSHLITKKIHFDYDPEATPDKFLGLLEHAVGKCALPYLQKLLGYSMTGDTSEKTFIIVWGKSDTGKTTFLEILRRLLEEYAVLLQVDTLMEKRGGDSAVQEDLVSLRGARIATTSELDQNRKLSIAAIKRIVQGQGQITASAKYEKKITFQESHKLWFDTNHLPVIPPDEQAVWNRVAIIVFSNPVPKDQQDKKLADTILRDEASAILAWMAEGEHMRQKEGLGEPPESFAAAKEEWRKKMDVIQQFIEECCEPGLRESSNELYDAYVAWSGGANRAISHKVFTQRMARLDHPLDGARRHYLGVSLASRSKTRES